MSKGGNAACVLNAANEVAVAAFLKDRIGFLQMSSVVEKCLEKVSFVKTPGYAEYVETDKETRRMAEEII